MGAGTGKGIIPGRLDYLGPHGIALDITYGPMKMVFVQEAGEKSPLPQMAKDLLLPVVILGITHVNGVKGLRQRIFVMRDNDKMDVVFHETVGEDI